MASNPEGDSGVAASEDDGATPRPSITKASWRQSSGAGDDQGRGSADGEGTLLGQSMVEDHFSSTPKSRTSGVTDSAKRGSTGGTSISASMSNNDNDNNDNSGGGSSIRRGAGRSGLRQPKTLSNSIRAVTEPKDKDPTKATTAEFPDSGLADHVRHPLVASNVHEFHNNSELFNGGDDSYNATSLFGSIIGSVTGTYSKQTNDANSPYNLTVFPPPGDPKGRILFSQFDVLDDDEGKDPLEFGDVGDDPVSVALHEQRSRERVARRDRKSVV